MEEYELLRSNYEKANENATLYKLKADKEESKINSTYQCIVDLCQALRVNDIPYEEIINNLDKRTKRVVKESIANSGYTKLEFNQSIHDRLITNVESVFKIKQLETVDENGFLQLDDDYKNPWEE